MDILVYNQLRLVVCPIIYKVVYIPGGAGSINSIPLKIKQAYSKLFGMWKWSHLKMGVLDMIDFCKKKWGEETQIQRTMSEWGRRRKETVPP